MAWVRARLCKLQKSDKVYQLLAHGRWFSPGTPASSIAKTGRHDIDDILLKVTLSTKNKQKINKKNHRLLYHDNRLSRRQPFTPH